LATNFPASLDNLNNPNSTDSMAGHAALHGNVNDAIEAIQAKIGVDGSADSSSIDYKVSQLESQLFDLDNQSDATLELLGLEGNNDLTITGIENKTAVDTWAASVYRTIKYNLQITRGSEYHTSDFLLLNDGTDINVSESNIISNTSNNLASVTFELNAGIISLCVTPTTSAVTARFVRTALKA
jgi:hypothetical protein